MKQLYEMILQRESPILPHFERIAKFAAMSGAKTIHEYLKDRADRLDERCDCCLERSARGSFTRYVYETPWDSTETEKHFCSEDCEQSYLYEGDFSYFMCEWCQREICGQHPRNGWHIQYRENDGQTICLRCYEQAILENGVERQKLENGKIPGMFFSHANIEPKEAGYLEVPGFRDFFINSEERLEEFRHKALSLIDEGYKVVIGYERLAIGGSEGYVTLMAKKEDSQNSENEARAKGPT